MYQCKKTAFLRYRFFTQHIYIYSYIYSFYVADQDTARYIFCSVQEECVSLVEPYTTDS